MNNKQQINRLRDNAELAWASYGYFDLVGKKFGNKNEYKGRKDTVITLHDILDSTYNGYIAMGKDCWEQDIKLGTLNGDFTPTQVKNFFKKYDVLIHQPNTDSGFSATLFGEKRKQTNTESKDISYTSKYGYTNYILAIRGTEPNNMGDIKTDANLMVGNIPKAQYLDMLLFYYQCIGTIPFYVELDSIPQDNKSLEYKLWQKLYQRSKESQYKPYINPLLLKDSIKPPFVESSAESNFTPPIDSKTKITLTGHSLGGCLAQLFTLSFANVKSSGIINEVYTFNAPGAKNLKAPCFSKYFKIQSLSESSYTQTKESLIKFLSTHYKPNNPSDDYSHRLSKCCDDFLQTFYADKNHFGYYVLAIHHETIHTQPFGQDRRPRDIPLQISIKEKVDEYNIINKAYIQLLENYQTPLVISNKINHIETDSDNNPNNNENNLIQNLGEDIEGKHYYLNIGIDIKGMERHSIKSSTIILYFYEYLLDLEANRELLLKHMQELDKNKQSPAYQNYIGHKANKNKGKYQVMTALLNDFMQWNYNSLKEVNKEVLDEIKQEYKKQKKTNKDTPKPPEKVFPLVYLLSEISYIARIKDSKKIQEFDIYKMTDIITQLQETKIYTRILNKDFFDNLKNKQCSVAEIRSLLKCQPFIVVDENNEEILNEDNMAKLFFYKEFTTLASQILNTYGGEAI